MYIIIAVVNDLASNRHQNIIDANAYYLSRVGAQDLRSEIN